MMKIQIHVLLMTVLLVGCAHADVNPAVPESGDSGLAGLSGQIA